MPTSLLHSSKPLSKTWLNRMFSLVYAVALSVLLLRHCRNLIYSPSAISIALFLADFVIAFLWLTYQCFHWNPVERKVFPKNLKHIASESKYPPIDVLICTADPTKEPPIGVVNTALSVLAYEYPTEKLSVYISDDGGSKMTLYAFMECAKFAKQWIPYCKKYGVVDRAPEAYFGSQPSSYPETDHIKVTHLFWNTCFDNLLLFQDNVLNNVLKTGKCRSVIPVLPFSDVNPVRNTPVNK
ncbi:putative cellulose synthase (UDP-forming) [Helianthus debilis subsp. tardiflorus]